MQQKTRSTAIWIARTAVLLAIAVLFQSLRTLIPGLTIPVFPPVTLDVLVVGTLVNLTLCVAAGMAGFWSGVIIGVLTPVIAFAQGHLQLPIMIPVVAAGNIAIVLLFWIFSKKVVFKGSMFVGTVLGTALKTLVLWFLVLYLIVPALAGFVPDPQKVKVQSVALPILFSWPQAITGAAGGILAAIILPLVRRGTGETGRKKAVG